MAFILQLTPSSLYYSFRPHISSFAASQWCTDTPHPSLRFIVCLCTQKHVILCGKTQGEKKMKLYNSYYSRFGRAEGKKLINGKSESQADPACPPCWYQTGARRGRLHALQLFLLHQRTLWSSPSFFSLPSSDASLQSFSSKQTDKENKIHRGPYMCDTLAREREVS